MPLLSGRARLAGILGWPVAHSRSPLLHGTWLARHGVDGAYLPLPVRPERFADVGARRWPISASAAPTSPSRTRRRPSRCATGVAPSAERAGAVNTLVFREDGRIEGSNTDGFGFMENCAQAVPGWSAAAGPAVLLGAGGSARAIAAALLDAGCPRLTLVNRNAGAGRGAGARARRAGRGGGPRRRWKRPRCS